MLRLENLDQRKMLEVYDKLNSFRGDRPSPIFNSKVLPNVLELLVFYKSNFSKGLFYELFWKGAYDVFDEFWEVKIVSSQFSYVIEYAVA